MVLYWHMRGQCCVALCVYTSAITGRNASWEKWQIHSVQPDTMMGIPIAVGAQKKRRCPPGLENIMLIEWLFAV